jgi:hypothetical protein
MIIALYGMLLFVLVSVFLLFYSLEETEEKQYNFKERTKEKFFEEGIK